ncbi:hypothetical protein [Paraburkholderia sediminicola]|uniref:hypothetical protein n=1 Tax=Paraburkholderia sediminicola TaxID=458836 RepID=UPI0038BACBEC
MRRDNGATYLFAASIFFFSLNAFSIRATFGAYLFICILAFARAPTLLSQQRGAFQVSIYWLLSVSITFILSAFGDFYVNFYLKFIMIQTYIALIYVMFSCGVLELKTIEKACAALIYIHAAFFIFQLSYYLAAGTFVDFDSYVREADSQALYATKALSDSLISIRALGLYSEPSFYAMTVVPAGVFLLLSKRRFTLASIVAFSTALLSLSIASIIVCGLIVVVHLMLGQSSKRVKLLIVTAALLCTPTMYDVYDKRVNQSIDYDAAGSRTLILSELKDRDTLSGLVGSGLFWDERNNVGRTHLRGYQVRDSSFYIYLLFGSGVTGTTIFFGALFVVFRKRGQRRYLFYLFPILLFKFHALYGMLWLTLLMFVILADRVPFESNGHGSSHRIPNYGHDGVPVNS